MCFFSFFLKILLDFSKKICDKYTYRKCGRSSGVERNLAKVDVEGSNPFTRSNKTNRPLCRFFCWLWKGVRTREEGSFTKWMSLKDSPSITRTSILMRAIPSPAPIKQTDLCVGFFVGCGKG